MLLQITFGNLATGLTRTASRYRQRQLEEEERRKQAEAEALRRQVLEFNLSEGVEARQARRRQEKAAEQTRRAEAVNRQRVGEILRRQGATDAEVTAFTSGLAEAGPILTALRRKQEGGGEEGGVTPTARYGARTRALAGLVDVAYRRANARWRQLTTGPLGSLREPRDPTTGERISLADLQAEELARLEQERGLRPGTLAEAEIDLAATADFNLEFGPEEAATGQRAAGPARSPWEAAQRAQGTAAPARAQPAPVARAPDVDVGDRGAPPAGGEGGEPIPAGDIAALQQAYKGWDPETVRQILEGEGIITSDIDKILAGI